MHSRVTFVREFLFRESLSTRLFPREIPRERKREKEEKREKKRKRERAFSVAEGR